MEYRLVSADSHVNELPDLWTSRAPARLRDLVPQVVEVDQGDAWVVHPDARPRPVSTSAAAGVSPQDYMKKPVTYREMRPGSFDPVARLEDMDTDGVDAEVLYPGIGRALDMAFDAEVRRFCAEAYNDWMAEFQSQAPERLVGLAILPPIDDGDSAARELERATDLGLRGAFLALPIGGKPLSAPEGDALWEVAVDRGVPISLHIGTGRALLHNLADASDLHLPGVREAYLSTVPIGIGDYIGTMVFGGVFDRHPGLRVVIAESGIGWLPWFLERMESVYDRHRHYLESKVQRPPSEIWRSHLAATFQEDRSGLALRNELGVGTLMWASDYPHTDTTWPDSQNVVKKYFADVADGDRRRIVADNAVELYGLDAFSA